MTARSWAASLFFALALLAVSSCGRGSSMPTLRGMSDAGSADAAIEGAGDSSAGTDADATDGPDGPVDGSTGGGGQGGGLSFVHPGVAFSLADLDRMKTHRTLSPWSTGYEAMTALPTASLDYVIQGPFDTVGREPDLNLGQYENDGQAVLYQAIQWYMTGNHVFADQAIRILMAWSTTHVTWSGGTPFLAATDLGLTFVIGAEILRYTYPGWTAEVTATTENYFVRMLWPLFDVGPGLSLRSANQGAAQLKGAMAVAVYTNSRERFDEVVSEFLEDPCGGLSNSLPSGQVGDTGRDQGHALGEIQNLVWAAETAWKQGLDLFGTAGNRLLSMSEYFASYNLSNDVPFSNYGTCYGFYTSIGSSGRGLWSWGPASYEILYGAYVARKGLAAPSTTKYRDALAPTPDTFLYRKDMDGSRALSSAESWVPPSPPLVTTLVDADVGSVGLPGNAIYAQSGWTLTGAGADVWGGSDSFHFAYRALSADGVVSARVTSLSGGASLLAKAGVMVRATLAPTSPVVHVYLQPGTSGAQAFWRSSSSSGFQNAATLPVPGWVKIVRYGNYVRGYVSSDGTIWSPITNVYLADLPSSALFGLTACSHDVSVLEQGQFQNVTLGP